MSYLFDLVHAMSDKEESALQSYYAVNESNSNIDYNKGRWRLFELLKSVNKEPTNKELAKMLFDENRSITRITTLKTRLRKDIVNVFVLLSGKEQYKTKKFAVRYEIRQEIIEAEILLSRGFDELAFGLLRSLEKRSKKFELTYERMHILDLLQDNHGIRSSLKKFERYSQEKGQELGLLASKYQAKRLYQEATLPSFFSASQEARNTEKSEILVKRIADIYNETGSLEIYSLYLRGKAFLDFSSGSLTTAKALVQEYLKLLEDNVHLQSNSTIAGANMQLSMLTLSQEQYSESILYSKKAVQYFAKGSQNMVSALSNLFLAYLHLGYLEDASRTLDKARRVELTKRDSFQSSIWSYYNAALKFRQGDIDSALFQLQKKSQLLVDKQGYSIGYKLLEIMCYLEQHRFDMVEFRVDALSRQIRRASANDQPRLRAVASYFRQMVDVHPDPEKVDSILSVMSKEKWDPMGYELVDTSVWCNEFWARNKN